jgi:hypothetical protein
MVDHFIKPWLIGFGIQMPMLLTILGVVGGFIGFRFLGLFIAPTLIAIMLTLLQACHLSGRSFDFTDIEIRRFVSLLKHADDGQQCPEWVNRVGSHPLRVRPLKASEQTFSIPISSSKGSQERKFGRAPAVPTWYSDCPNQRQGEWSVNRVSEQPLYRRSWWHIAEVMRGNDIFIFPGRSVTMPI